MGYFLTTTAIKDVDTDRILSVVEEYFSHHGLGFEVARTVEDLEDGRDVLIFPLITNEFNRLWPHGSQKPTKTELKELMNKVYEKFPLPKSQ